MSNQTCDCDKVYVLPIDGSVDGAVSGSGEVHDLGYGVISVEV